MAIVHRSLDDIRAARPKVDRARIAATTEEDIRRHQIEDGESPDAPFVGFEPNVLAQAVRRKLNMTQEEFAAALHIPIGTVRNWEQGRVTPDPAARSLLLIAYRQPEALKALEPA